jgi:hypothetical protein
MCNQLVRQELIRYAGGRCCTEGEIETACEADGRAAIGEPWFGQRLLSREWGKM